MSRDPRDPDLPAGIARALKAGRIDTENGDSGRRLSLDSAAITAVVNLIGKYGLGSVLALGLVYWMAVSLNGKIDKHAEDTRSQFDQLIRINRIACANSSKTDEARAACWEELRR